MNYYQHHIGDFVRDTSCLTNGQCMAYLRLLWMYYESEEPLTANVRVLAMRTGASESDVELLLEAFFKQDGNVWRHNRCDREIAAYKRMSEGGKHGAAKRWGKPGDRGAIGGLSPGQCTLNANQEPITNISTSLRSVDKRATRFDALAHLVSIGVEHSIASDWIQHRKTIKASPSQTAIDGIARESERAGISLSDALAMCCQRGWRGFKAEWVATAPINGKVTQHERNATFMDALLSPLHEREVVSVIPKLGVA